MNTWGLFAAVSGLASYGSEPAAGVRMGAPAADGGTRKMGRARAPVAFHVRCQPPASWQYIQVYPANQARSIMSRRILTTQAPGTTEQVDSTDAAQQLPADSRTHPSTGAAAQAVFITLEGNSIRYAFGVDPTQDSGTALGHVLAAGDAIRLAHEQAISDFKFISQASGAHGTLQITAEF